MVARYAAQWVSSALLVRPVSWMTIVPRACASIMTRTATQKEEQQPQVAEQEAQEAQQEEQQPQEAQQEAQQPQVAEQEAQQPQEAQQEEQQPQPSRGANASRAPMGSKMAMSPM